MSTPKALAAERVARRVQPHLALVELRRNKTGRVLAPAVCAGRDSVALSMRYVAGQRITRVNHATIRVGRREWPASLAGFRPEWDTCCYSSDDGELPVRPVRIRWSHTLQEMDQIVAVKLRPDFDVEPVLGLVDTVEPDEGRQPYERSQYGVAYFTAPVEPGTLLFDMQARLAGVLSQTFDRTGIIGPVIPAERLSGLPDVPLYMSIQEDSFAAQMIVSESVRCQEDPRILGAVAVAARRIGDRDLRLVAVERMLELDPDHPWGHFERAAVLEELGRSEESLRAMERAAELDPDTYEWRPLEETF